MSDKGFTVSGVKEISRGKDWVKFLVSFSGEKATYSSVSLAHADWVNKGLADDFGCGWAEVMKFNFDDSKAVFKFATEPYSMKSNDCYRYIDAFGKWDGKRGPGVSGNPDVSANPGVSEASGTTSAGEKPVFDAKSVVDDIIDGLKNIRIAGIDFGKPEKDLVIDMAPYAGKFIRSDSVNVPSCRTAGEFRTTNDVRVKSLISRLKAK